MEEALSPDLFLFQRIVIDILDYCKKNIRAPPFDQMNVQELVKGNKKQQIDIYHQYFLQGLAHNKTREYVSKKYDQLIRDNLINKDYLPPNFITSIINSRPSAGSTASSGSGSVGSAISHQMNSQRSVHLGKLISTIVCSTIQPSSEIIAAFNFLLDGTKNKIYGSFFYSLMQEVYISLSKYRHSPSTRFASHFLTYILNQVQYHEEIYQDLLKMHSADFNEEEYKFEYVDRSSTETQRKLCIHQLPSNFLNSPHSYPNTQEAKFGKCFICERDANNYDKLLFVPLCSIECKNKLKRINQECLLNDHFDMFDWLLETLVYQNNSEQIIYSLFMRELQQNQLRDVHIVPLLETLITNLSISNTILGAATNVSNTNLQNLLSQLPVTNIRILDHSVMIFSELFKKYPSLLLLQHFHKITLFLYEVIRFMELLPISNSSLQLNILKSMFDVLELQLPERTLVVKQLYIGCDCQIFGYNIVQRMFNILSQYAVNHYTLISGANLSGVSSGISNPSHTKQEGSIATMTNLSQINLPHTSNLISSGGDGNQKSINIMDKFLGKLCKKMKKFEDQLSFMYKHDIGNESGRWQNIVAHKSLKKFLQTIFIPNFNKKPIKYLEKSISQIPLKPQALALFFFINLDYESKLKKPHPYIAKASLGQLFGSNKDFPQKLYKHFLQYLQPQYQNLEIDDCLRITFNTFSLPKEAQQIEVIFNELSLVLQPHLNMKVGESGTATYQWIMATLMVQTSTNPNVKEKQKISLQDFKGICSRIQGGVDELRVTDVFSRIKKRPLQQLMDWRGSNIFNKKYISQKILISIEEEVGKQGGWKWETKIRIKQEEQSLKESRMSTSQQCGDLSQSSVRQQKEEKVQGTMENCQKEEIAEIKEEQSIVFLESQSKLQSQPEPETKITLNPSSLFLINFWEYLYVSLVNNNNLIGLDNVCLLYGRSQLKGEFQTFFSSIYKIYKDAADKSTQSKHNLLSNAVLMILKYAIQNGNYVLGVNSWFNIIKLIYRLDEEEKFKDLMRKQVDNSYHTYLYECSDQLFTRSKQLSPQRLKEFLDAMCEFSSSQFKTEKKYTRELYILHHITQIIQYNIKRLSLRGEDDRSLFEVLWPTLKPYFHSISMHPRREISLAAIDAYKQLTMKILKISFESNQKTQEAHEKLFSIYQYTFQRSPSDIRDFIINILLNVVSKDMRAGWDYLFNVLEGADCADKTVVMRIIERMVNEIGFRNIRSLNSLHSILIKQLRMNELVESSRRQEHCDKVLSTIWNLTEFLQDIQIWKQTLSLVKDIFKISSNNRILSFFYQICNYTWSIESESRSENLEIKAAVYEQILDIQVHLLENKNVNKLKQALYLLFTLNKDIVLYNLGSDETSIIRASKKRRKSSITCSMINQSTSQKQSLSATLINDGIGFISLWEMFITSPHGLVFCNFIRDYSIELFKHFKEGSLHGLKQEKIIYFKILLLQWNYKLFTNSESSEILKLCSQDEDLNLQFYDILKKDKKGIEAPRSAKIQLIEFSLSSRQYTIKATQHLIYLDIFKHYSRIFFDQAPNQQDSQPELALVNLHQQLKSIQNDFLSGIVQSHKVACNINDRPLLRNFLWHNQFLSNTSKQSYLPGLLKQQMHAYQILNSYGLAWVKKQQEQEMRKQIARILVDFMQRFNRRMELYMERESSNNKNEEENQKQMKNKNSANLQRQLYYQDIGLWLTNNEQLVVETVDNLIEDLSESQGQRQYFKQHYKQILDRCLNLAHGPLHKQTIQRTSQLIELTVAKIY